MEIKGQSLELSFKRTNSVPLDATQQFYSLSDLVDYAANNDTEDYCPLAGQLCAVKSTSRVYKLVKTIDTSHTYSFTVGGVDDGAFSKSVTFTQGKHEHFILEELGKSDIDFNAPHDWNGLQTFNTGIATKKIVPLEDEEEIFIDGDINMQDNLHVQGEIEVDSQFTANYDAEIKGNTDIGEDLYVKGNTILGQDNTKTLEVKGTSIFNQNATFKKDVTVKGDIGTLDNFDADITTGHGWKVDKDGAAWMESLVVRSFLEVPEMRYNRVTVNSGTTWNAAGAGTILKVQGDTIFLKLEKGEVGSFAQDDLCMGIWHYNNAAYDNIDINADDKNAGLTVDGFCRVYFAVDGVSDYYMNAEGNIKKSVTQEELATYTKYENGAFSFILRNEMPLNDGVWNISAPPMPQMSIVAFGNISNKSRQTSAYATRTFKRYLSGVNSWKIKERNIAAQFGDLSNLTINGVAMKDYSAYISNIYMTGTVKQFDNNSNEIETLNYRGAYTQGVIYYKNDEVYCDNALWVCITHHTSNYPNEDDNEWYQLSGIGADGKDGATFSVTEYYAISNSKTTAPSTANNYQQWSTQIKSPTYDKPYLWNIEIVTNNGVAQVSGPAVIAFYSKDGRGISQIVEYYMIAAKNSNVPYLFPNHTTNTIHNEREPDITNSPWSKTPGNVTNENSALYNCELIRYTDASWSFTEPQMIGTKGDKGEQGKSAYEIYKENGGSLSSQSAWLNSLVGAEGKSAYQLYKEEQIANNEEYKSLEEWIAAHDGKQGLSAYDLYCANGGTLNEAGWLASLKGDKGDSVPNIEVTATRRYRTSSGTTVNPTPSLIINGINQRVTNYEKSNTYSRGHCVIAIDPHNMTVKYGKWFDCWVAGSETPNYETNINSEITAINDYSELGYIIVLISSDASSCNESLRTTLKGLGGLAEGVWERKNVSHFFIGHKGLKSGQAYEEYYDNGAVELHSSEYIKVFCNNVGIIAKGANGIDGTNGYNAYELYALREQEQGKTPKSESEWFSSLVGKDGESNYQIYLRTTQDSPKLSEAEWLASLDGEDGLSAYDIYKAQAGSSALSQSDWLASLHGKDGTSVSIKGTKNYVSELPSNATTGDGWMINGDLYVRGEDGNWTNVGRIKGDTGATGVGIYSRSETYAASDSNTVTPLQWYSYESAINVWGTTKKYLWNKETYTLTDGTSKASTPHVVAIWSEDGVGIEEVVDYYATSQINTSPEIPDSGSLSYDNYKMLLGTSDYWESDADSIDNINENYPYAWNFELIKYTDGSFSVGTPHLVGHFGKDGLNGADGKDGKDGKSITEREEYYAATSTYQAPVIGNSAWKGNAKDVNWNATNKYLWNYEVIQYTSGSPENTTPRCIGVYGQKGTDGADGKSIAYIDEYVCTNNSDTAKTIPNVDDYPDYEDFRNQALYYGWNVNDGMVNVTPENPNLWNFEVIVLDDNETYCVTPAHLSGHYGRDGVDGKDGANGSDGSVIDHIDTYYIVKNTANKIPSDSEYGTTTKPTWANGKYIWSRLKFVFVDDTEMFSDWVCGTGANGNTGETGAIIRQRGYWSNTALYYNNSTYIDVVINKESGDRYMAKSDVPKGTALTNTTYWQVFNDYKPIATSVLLANTGEIDVLGAGQLFVHDSSSEYGWVMTNGKIRHTQSGLELTNEGKLSIPSGCLSFKVGDKELEQVVSVANENATNALSNVNEISEDVELLQTDVTSTKNDITKISKNLLDTGIDIENKSITVTSDTFKIQNNKGEQNAYVDSKGNLVISGYLSEKSTPINSIEDFNAIAYPINKVVDVFTDNYETELVSNSNATQYKNGTSQFVKAYPMLGYSGNSDFDLPNYRITKNWGSAYQNYNMLDLQKCNGIINMNYTEFNGRSVVEQVVYLPHMEILIGSNITAVTYEGEQTMAVRLAPQGNTYRGNALFTSKDDRITSEVNKYPAYTNSLRHKVTRFGTNKLPYGYSLYFNIKGKDNNGFDIYSSEDMIITNANTDKEDITLNTAQLYYYLVASTKNADISVSNTKTAISLKSGTTTYTLYAYIKVNGTLKTNAVKIATYSGYEMKFLRTITSFGNRDPHLVEYNEMLSMLGKRFVIVNNSVTDMYIVHDFLKEVESINGTISLEKDYIMLPPNTSIGFTLERINTNDSSYSYTDKNGKANKIDTKITKLCFVPDDDITVDVSHVTLPKESGTFYIK